MPFLEGMGDQKIPGAPKRAVRDGAAFSADAAASGPGVPEASPGPGPSSPPAVKPDKPWQRRRQQTETPYGLPSRSEMMFPEAYQPVSSEFWEGLSQSQRNEVIHLQAVAQEKVGFERGTPKYFIEDFDPDQRAEDPEVRLVTMATPRLMAGGALIGAGLTLAAVGFGGALAIAPALLWAGLLCLSGIAVAVVGR